MGQHGAEPHLEDKTNLLISLKETKSHGTMLCNQNPVTKVTTNFVVSTTQRRRRKGFRITQAYGAGKQTHYQEST